MRAPAQKKTRTRAQVSPTRKSTRRPLSKQQVQLAKELLNHALNKVVNDSLTTYGKYVVEERAIPAEEDGLKPSQRRSLWALYHDKGSRPEKGFIKAATAEGATMAYHPHGGTYGTMVNMIEGTTCPLLTGWGNYGGFSKLYSPPAAPRYTELKINKFCMEVLFDKRFEKVYPRVPSYTGESEEPVWLPSQLPLILAMGATGIALGVMTNIPAFTVPSLYKVVYNLFKKKMKPTARLLAKYLEFGSAYGGKMISPPADVLTLMDTGVGSIEWICDYAIRGKYLHIVGIPPGWSFDSKAETIRNLPFVTAVEDLTSRTGVDVRISFKRLNEDDFQDAISKVKKLLTSKIHYKCNTTNRTKVEDELVATTSAKFQSKSIVQIIEDWMTFRVDIEKKARKIEENELTEALRHQELMQLAVINLDLIFKLLKTRNIDKVKKLAVALKITEEESKEIWSIAVGRLDRLSETEITTKIKELTKRRAEVKALFKTPEISIVKSMDENVNLTKPVSGM